MEKAADLTIAVNDTDHIQGSAMAPVTLLEYGDYQCPYCGLAYPIIKEVQQKLGPRLRFVFRNFPLNTAHPYAEIAAEAAEAAAEQDMFWDMHDALYENQKSLGEGLIMRLAESVGLELKRFFESLESRKYKDKVKKDFMSGVKSGVNGTPGFFINGQRYDGDWQPEPLYQALSLL